MRFFEFKLPEPDTKFYQELKGYLLKLVSKSNSLPDTDPRKIKFVQKLDSVANEKIGEDASVISQVDTDTVAAVLAYLSKQGVKEATMFLLDTAKILGDTQVQAALQKKGEVHANIEFGAGKDINAQLKKSAKMLSAKISGTLEALKQQYDEQYKEGDLQAPKKESTSASDVNQELVDLIEGIFSKPISGAETAAERNKTASQILDFMNRCQTGIVDLKQVIDNGKGNVLSSIEGEDKRILDMLENALMKAKPGKTAGNWGPGELGLAILGTPVNKASKGDLDIGGEMIELKASQNPKQGGRLGTRALARGTDGRSKYVSALSTLLSEAGHTLKTASLKPDSPVYVGIKKDSKKQASISHLNFGQGFVNSALNPLIANKVSPDSTAKFLEQVAISCIVNDHIKDVKTAWVKKCVNSDGTINIEAFNLKYAGMLYSLYQRVDGVGKIMILNPLTGSYYVLNGPNDIASAAADRDIPIQFGTTTINFGDSQGKASPQLGI
jgi:hypothetical protein